MVTALMELYRIYMQRMYMLEVLFNRIQQGANEPRLHCVLHADSRRAL